MAEAGAVIDVGGGTSRLALRLRAGGYDVTVLDISAAAVERARAALGEGARGVRWVIGDVTRVADVGPHDVWHDRAAFHFLIERQDRESYAKLLRRTIRPGGHAIIATFAPDGPARCSGLPVMRYDATALAAELGAGLQLLKSVPEIHVTPAGTAQSFQYSVFRRA